MDEWNRSRGVGDVDAHVGVEAEAHDETSLAYLEAYGLILWRNGSVDKARAVFEGLHTLAQAWESPEIPGYARVLEAINSGVTYAAYASEFGDETD